MDRYMKKSFTHFYLTNPLPEIPRDKALLIAPNHMSWWDPFFVDVMNRRIINRKLHVMMLEDQLTRYWFFKKVGAFSINPSSEESVSESLDYTSGILKDPGNMVIFFPQGRIEPYDKRPVEIRKRGLSHLAEKSRDSFVILPLAQKIVYDNKPEPDAWFHFGNLVKPSMIRKDFAGFTSLFRQTVNNLDQLTLQKDYYQDLFTWKW